MAISSSKLLVGVLFSFKVASTEFFVFWICFWGFFVDIITNKHFFREVV